MELAKLILVSIFVAFLITSLEEAQEVEAGSEFNYVIGDPRGPARWGLLRPEWKLCSKGNLQSPIDIRTENAMVDCHLGRLLTNYQPAKAIVINRGYDVTLRWQEDAGGFRINGTEYKLNELHWHSPSEHKRNGMSFNLELHMVHTSADGEIAVIGIQYMIGLPDPFLAKLEDHIRAVKDRENYQVDAGIVNPTKVGIPKGMYYRYVGSLTTPPCTEGVIWTVLHTVKTVSIGQLKLLREAVNNGFENNARPVQPFNDRVLKFYSPLHAWCKLQHP